MSTATTLDRPASPFHDGEQAVQQRLGVREQVEPWARRVVRDHLPGQHRDFYAALAFVVAAARDTRGRPWATLLAGAPGFIDSPDDRSLRIAARLPVGDALEHALLPGADLGLLGIELSTRRRNRVNGRLGAVADDALVLDVEQSFGNCPQYIHEREWRSVTPASPAPAPRRASSLNTGQRRCITAADTFFIATGHRGAGNDPAFGMDASHRGGEPGFVRVETARRLVFPDYAGNNHYNTIGNLELDPRAGLLFVEFASGGLLQLTGRATVQWEGAALADFPGARRLVAFDIDEVVELGNVLPLRWQSLPDARPLRVTDKVRESEDVISFWLAAADARTLADFEPGQHLPVELDLPATQARVRRTWTLSNPPGSERYRITVKREPHGLASRALHDDVKIGDVLHARPPAGEFVLRPGSRPVVLVSAGVGVTPMASMLGWLAERGDPRPVLFVHAARDGAHHPLAAEVCVFSARAADARVHVFYSRPRAADLRGRDYDEAGRLDAARLLALLPDHDADFYLCGPSGFMAALTAGLATAGVPPERVFTESFGGAG